MYMCIMSKMSVIVNLAKLIWFGLGPRVGTWKSSPNFKKIKTKRETKIEILSVSRKLEHVGSNRKLNHDSLGRRSNQVS